MMITISLLSSLSISFPLSLFDYSITAWRFSEVTDSTDRYLPELTGQLFFNKIEKNVDKETYRRKRIPNESALP
jgi:hypothetical protein